MVIACIQHTALLARITLKVHTMKKLLWVSNMGYGCSYDVVSKSVIHNLVKRQKYDIYILCGGIVFYEKDTIDRLSREFHLPKDRIFILNHLSVNNALPEELAYANNYVYAVYAIPDLVEKIKPDLVFSLNDIGPISRQSKILNRPDIFVPYMTVDLARSPTKSIDFPIKHLITMNEFSKKELDRANSGAKIYTLPHMIDCEQFHPLDNRTELRTKWLGEGNENRYVIGCVNSNHARKRWDITIRVFCQFASKHDNAFMLLKTPELHGDKRTSIIPNITYELPDLIQRTFKKYGLSVEKHIRTYEGTYTIAEINEMYNCCDVGLSTTSGEGWGLIPCEMALAHIPIIIPRWTSFPEIFENSVGLVDVDTYPHQVGRYWLNPIKELDHSYYVILKSLISVDEEIDERDYINIEPGYSAIIISPFGEDRIYESYSNSPLGPTINLIGFFKTVKFASNFYKDVLNKNNVGIQRLLVAVCMNTEYLKSQLNLLTDVRATFPPTPLRHLVYVKKDSIKIIATDFDGVVGIPPEDKVLEKLELFYSRPDIALEDARYCADLIQRKYNPDTVTDLFIDIIEDISPPTNVEIEIDPWLPPFHLSAGPPKKKNKNKKKKKRRGRRR